MIPSPSRRTIVATASGLSLAVVALAGTALASSHHDVTLEVDGVSVGVSGFSRTVADVLAARGVTVSAHDLVAPGLDEPVSDGDQVVVRTASQYSLTVDGKAVTAWSTGDSLAAVLADAPESGTVTLAADRSQARPTLPLVTRGATVEVLADGSTHTLTPDASDTAASLLRRAGVTVSAIDRVRWVSTTDGSLALEVTRVTRGLQTQTQKVAHSTEKREDPDLAKGTTSVVRAGRDGKVVTTTFVETVAGKPTVSTVVSRTKTAAVSEVVAVGTKEPVVQAAAPSSTSTASSAAPAGVWAALAQCESGGNPATNTGNGYYGLYQFSLPTWQAYGGVGLPSDASAAQQTAIAQKLQAASGWGQWPACAASLGLI